MATVVESTSIASARERAAAILLGNEKPINPVVNQTATNAGPALAEYSVPVHETAPAPSPFTSYYHTEPTRAPQTTTLRRYETPAEFAPNAQPRVVHPYLQSEDVVVAAPVDEVETPAVVQSEIDQELAEDTQYVVRFKKSTIAATAAIVAVFVLLAVLLIVNLVSLSGGAAALGQLRAENEALQQEYEQAVQMNQQAQANATSNINVSQYQGVKKNVLNTNNVEFYQPTMPEQSSGGFFDWLCKAFSGLFS